MVNSDPGDRAGGVRSVNETWPAHRADIRVIGGACSAPCVSGAVGRQSQSVVPAFTWLMLAGLWERGGACRPTLLVHQLSS